MRILARAPNWLGDAVMALPALAAFERLGALLVHATPGVAGVFRAAGHAVEEVPHGLSLRAIASVRRSRADAAVLLTNSFSSAAVALLGRSPRRIGYPLHARRWLLTDAIPLPDPRPHQIDEYLRLAEAAARALGTRLRPADVRPEPRLSPRPEEVERWRVRLTAWTGGVPAVGIAPGAAYGPAKRWPAERYAETARRLAEGGRRVVLIGAEADRPAAEAVRAYLPAGLAAADLVGATRTDDLPALLAALDGLVTNDSGAAHLAAAVGTPVVAIFGPTDPRRTAARGGRARHLWAGVECSPCHLRKCPIDHRCMTRIGPDDVVGALAAASA